MTIRGWSDLDRGEKLILAWGKVRRFYLTHFRPAQVRESLARRRGQCARTGACCHLLYTCPIYASNPRPTCRINDHKPKVCHVFPIDERDLKDRDIISPHVPCGFSFVPTSNKSGGVLPNP